MSDPTKGTGISFVVPVYNKRPFLPQVVAGLTAQRGDFAREFVFIDDGSTDGSYDEMQRLAAALPDARVLRQANAGPSVATNRGISEARYPLIKLVDGDDVLLPKATLGLHRALSRHPEAVLAYGGSDHYASQAEALSKIREAPTSGGRGEESVEDALPALLRECYLGPSNCLIRTSAARAVGGCDERVFVQDYSLLLRLATKGAFVATGIPVALHPRSPRLRLNDGGPQVLHDANLTLAFFLAEQVLPPALARKALRRGVTRSWLWAKRREGAPAFSSWYWLRLAAYLPIPGLAPVLLRRSCGAFTLSQKPRLSHPAA